VYSTMPKTP
ncbi:uncharacterized protein CELE_C09E8.6, partial [Caenorhabditis elegans]